MCLTKILHRMNPEVRTHTICILSRLLLDRGIVNNYIIFGKIEDIMSAIVDGMSEEGLDEEVSGLPSCYNDH